MLKNERGQNDEGWGRGRTERELAESGEYGGLRERGEEFLFFFFPQGSKRNVGVGGVSSSSAREK